MPYRAWDEYFVHQLPRTFDQVSDSEKSWSDRCYFNLHSPDASMLVTMGYGNNPNTQRAAGLREARPGRRAALGHRRVPAMRGRPR